MGGGILVLSSWSGMIPEVTDDTVYGLRGEKAMSPMSGDPTAGSEGDRAESESWPG